MTSLVARLLNEFSPNCVVTGSLNKEGCRVKLTRVLKSRVAIDFDKRDSPLTADAKRCDYLVVVETQRNLPLILLLELKRGKLDSNNAVSQLQAAAVAVEKFIPKNEAIEFLPIAVAGKMPRVELESIKKPHIKIRLHGYREPIRLLRCNDSLSKVAGF